MKLWFEYENLNRSLPRSIDRQTMIDLLSLIAYQSRRTFQLEQLGIEDKGDPNDVLLDYVLDALGAPPNEFKNFGREFDRNELYDLFYTDYILKNKYLTVEACLDELEQAAVKAAYLWQYRLPRVKKLMAS